MSMRVGWGFDAHRFSDGESDWDAHRDAHRFTDGDTDRDAHGDSNRCTDAATVCHARPLPLLLGEEGEGPGEIPSGIPRGGGVAG